MHNQFFLLLNFFLCSLFFIGTHNHALCNQKKPEAVIVLVIDQLSYQRLMTIKPYLHGALRMFLDKGIVYNSAHWPHSMPGTGAGHTGLSTGTTPNNHGITRNSWLTPQGTKILCDQDNIDASAVFSPNGVYSYGKSTRNIMVDTLSDQCMLASSPAAVNNVAALTLKSRSAIPMAGKRGKALWLDTESGYFTSSKAYFEQLPGWIQRFNTAHKQKHATIQWRLRYPFDSPAYKHSLSQQYAYSRAPSLINKTIAHADQPKKYKKYYETFAQTPQAHQSLLELSEQYFDQMLTVPNHGTILLFIGLSGVDKVGHIYGPDSREYLDILYHLDKQLDKFINHLYTKLPSQNILFVLTADHGSMSIPELLQQHKHINALRLDVKNIQKELNAHLEHTYGISPIIRFLEVPDLYLNHAIFDTLPKKKQEAIIQTIKKFLLNIPGIKQIWTYQELAAKSVNHDDILSYYKNQLFPGRSGDLIVQVSPYVYASCHAYGTGHKTPYEYDTQVPLIIYQPTVFEQKTIPDKVWVQQLAPTIARIVGIQQPSGCTVPVLPGISFTKHQQK